MAVAVKIPVDRVLDLEEALNTLTGLQVVVGFAGQHRSGMSNAQLAYIHDNGSPARNIPARPFFEVGIREGTPEIMALARQAASQALAQGRSGAQSRRHAMELVGDAAVNAVKRKILENDFVPLKRATVRRKGHDQALIDTGELYDSITSDVRRSRRTR